MYSINFTVTGNKIYFKLALRWVNSYFFVNSIEIYKFKAKDSEIVASSFCLGNILKEWSVDNVKMWKKQD